MDNSPHISYLWSSKLKSRDSFLTILEHMNIRFHEFETLLLMLKREGAIRFVEKFMWGNYTFVGNFLRRC